MLQNETDFNWPQVCVTVKKKKKKNQNLRHMILEEPTIVNYDSGGKNTVEPKYDLFSDSIYDT